MQVIENLAMIRCVRANIRPGKSREEIARVVHVAVLLLVFSFRL